MEDQEEEEFIRKNSLEISGVPEEKGEEIFEVIKKVGKGLGINVTPEMLEVYHRSGAESQTSDKPRGIVVKFARKKHKEEFLQKRRLKRVLRTKDVDLSGDSCIYINEILSDECRKVLNAARLVKKEKGFKYLWVRNGKVLLRKEENGNVITLSSLEQVAAL